MAHTTKCADELTRLIHFTQGKPDQRPELVGMDWLRALSTEQLHQVQAWIAENSTRDAEDR